MNFFSFFKKQGGMVTFSFLPVFFLIQPAAESSGLSRRFQKALKGAGQQAEQCLAKAVEVLDDRHPVWSDWLQRQGGTGCFVSLIDVEEMEEQLSQAKEGKTFDLRLADCQRSIPGEVQCSKDGSSKSQPCLRLTVEKQGGKTLLVPIGQFPQYEGKHQRGQETVAAVMECDTHQGGQQGSKCKPGIRRTFSTGKDKQWVAQVLGNQSQLPQNALQLVPLAGLDKKGKVDSKESVVTLEAENQSLAGLAIFPDSQLPVFLSMAQTAQALQTQGQFHGGLLPQAFVQETVSEGQGKVLLSNWDGVVTLGTANETILDKEVQGSDLKRMDLVPPECAYSSVGENLSASQSSALSQQVEQPKAGLFSHLKAGAVQVVNVVGRAVREFNGYSCKGATAGPVQVWGLASQTSELCQSGETGKKGSQSFCRDAAALNWLLTHRNNQEKDPLPEKDSKEENSQKTTVAPPSTSAFSTQVKKYKNQCKSKSQSAEELDKCYLDAYNTLLSALPKEPDSSQRQLQLLVLQGMHPDPQKRPTLDQWVSRLEALSSPPKKQ